MLTRLEYPTFLSTYVKHGRSLFLTTPPKKKYVYEVLTLLYTARLQKIYVYPTLCYLIFHRLHEKHVYPNLCMLKIAPPPKNISHLCTLIHAS